VTRVGETLTVAEGSWSGSQPMSYSYQWRRCNSSGGACVDISGAIAKTYLIVSGDAGSTLRVAVTASNGASVYGSAVSGDAPVSYWRFAETSGPLLDRQGFRNGSYVGGPARAVPGLLTGDANAAVSLSGSGQYLEVPAAAAWTPSRFSLEIVVRPTALPVNTTIWATAGVFAGWWLNTDSSGRLRMFVGDGGAWRFAAAAPVLNPGTTYHLLVSFNGNNARLYVNGQLVSTGPHVTMAASPTSLMRFGASNPAGQYWPGTLDEASFYRTALSPSQVQAHYNASITGSLATSTATAVVVGA
jgi:hypothetical protein